MATKRKKHQTLAQELKEEARRTEKEALIIQKRFLPFQQRAWEIIHQDEPAVRLPFPKPKKRTARPKRK